MEWTDLQNLVQDFKLLETLRNSFTVGVSVPRRFAKPLCVFFLNDFFQGTSTYLGRRPRTREVLQRRMYTTEIQEWQREASSFDPRVLASEDPAAACLVTA